jgi:hypothetical protein
MNDLDEPYSDIFDIKKLKKEIDGYARDGYKGVKGFYLLAAVERARIPEKKLPEYGRENEYGIL